MAVAPAAFIRGRITVKSRFKNLVVSGCSFTYESPDSDSSSPWSWANVLGSWTDMKVHNLAIPGAGNDHISKSIILYLEKNKFDPADTLVLVMWTGIGKIDWITNKSSSKFSDHYSVTYDYDNNNELVLGGNWWNIDKSQPILNTLVNYSKYQSDSTFALHSWLAMKNLSNYLRVNNFEYYFTSYVSYNSYDTNNIKGDAVNVSFYKELEKINLSIDQSDWLSLNDNDHYGDWARERKLLAGDNLHPKYPANQGWVKEILMPVMASMGSLDT